MSDTLWWIVLAVLFVLSLLSLRWGRGRRLPGMPGLPVPLVIDEELRVRVTGLIAAGKKVEAIKALRDGTGLPLMEAKEHVDVWDLVTGQARIQATTPELRALEVEARAELAEHGSIRAVKLVRERTGWGLVDAKAYVDRLGRT